MNAEIKIKFNSILLRLVYFILIIKQIIFNI